MPQFNPNRLKSNLKFWIVPPLINSINLKKPLTFKVLKFAICIHVCMYDESYIDKRYPKSLKNINTNYCHLLTCK